MIHLLINLLDLFVNPLTLVFALLLKLLHKVKDALLLELKFCLKDHFGLGLLNGLVLNLQVYIASRSDKLQNEMVSEDFLVDDSLVTQKNVEDIFLFLLLFFLIDHHIRTGLLRLFLRDLGLLWLGVELGLRSGLPCNIVDLSLGFFVVTHMGILDGELDLGCDIECYIERLHQRLVHFVAPSFLV